MKCSNTVLLGVLLLAAPALADMDVRPQVQDSRIVTGGFSDQLNQAYPPGIHAFGYAFQEDELKPYETTDPGFNADEGSGLTPGKQLSINVVDASRYGLPGNLSYWNGGGSVQFAPAPADASLQLSFVGQGSVTIDSSPGGAPGFALGTVLSDGSFHRHLTADLASSSANNPADGIYLLALELTINDPAITKSLPFFIFYNNGLTDQQDTDAFNYITTQLVPRLLPGDTNGDGQVDVVDYNNVLNHFQMTGNPVLGDTNRDGIVDVVDYDNVLNNFQQHLAVPAWSVKAVPEPSTLLLMAVGLVFFVRGRLRRRTAS